MIKGRVLTRVTTQVANASRERSLILRLLTVANRFRLLYIQRSAPKCISMTALPSCTIPRLSVKRPVHILFLFFAFRLYLLLL